MDLCAVFLFLGDCECVDICAVASGTCATVVSLCGVATVDAVEIGYFLDCVLCSG